MKLFSIILFFSISLYFAVIICCGPVNASDSTLDTLNHNNATLRQKNDYEYSQIYSIRQITLTSKNELISFINIINSLISRNDTQGREILDKHVQHYINLYIISLIDKSISMNLVNEAANLQYLLLKYYEAVQSSELAKETAKSFIKNFNNVDSSYLIEDVSRNTISLTFAISKMKQLYGDK